MRNIIEKLAQAIVWIAWVTWVITLFWFDLRLFVLITVEALTLTLIAWALPVFYEKEGEE